MKLFKRAGYSGMLLGILLTSVPGQERQVTRISIVGNELTKDYIIRREILHPAPAPFDSRIVEEDRNRIENLRLFSMVAWDTLSGPDGALELRYYVLETWRFLPGLAPVYDERTGWSLSGMLIVSNLRGRNQTLQFSGLIGGIDSYGVSFSDPWIMGDHVSLSVIFDNESLQHMYLPYLRRTLALRTITGRYSGYQHKYWLGLDLVQRRFIADRALVSDFRYLAPSLRYQYDTRDLYGDPAQGLVLDNQAGVVFDLEKAHRNRVEWWVSYSAYHSLRGGKHKLVLAASLRGKLSLRYLDEFWIDYLGGAYTVRGWRPPDSGIYESPDQAFRFGHHWLVTALELRQVLIPRFTTRIGNEFGMTAVLFLDLGIISHQLDALLETEPLMGTGIGIRIPMPMLDQLRLDYGWAIREGKVIGDQLHLAYGHAF